MKWNSVKLLKRKSKSLKKKKNLKRSKSLKKKKVLKRKKTKSLKKKLDGKGDEILEKNYIVRINSLEKKIKELEDNVMTKFPNITISVVQLVSYFKDIDPFFPHVNSNEYRAKGSGFIIDIDNGLILTNSHVVQNSIYLYALTEKFRQRRIELKIISLCIEKDIALCQIINREDRKDIKGDKKSEEINLKFVDSFNLKHLEKVFVIGYPLGFDNIKATGGTITGFYSNNDEEGNNILIDSEDTSSYIETSAPVNPGNSGGPLINMNGEVIGIVSAGLSFVGFMRIAQNVNYVIGSRTILSIFDELSKSLSYKNKVIIPARYSFIYKKTSKIQLEKIGCKKEGIYICKVFPDSSFKYELMEGDILCGITFNDIYKNEECFDIINKNNCGSEKEENIMSYEIKSDGFIINKKYKDRKFILKELFDSIPIGTKLTLDICRNTKNKNVEVIFNNEQGILSNRNKIVLSAFEPYKFIISHGLCIGELTLNHVFLNPNLIKFIEGENRYKNFLIINWIFSQTEASNLGIQKGTIISKVNNTPVTTIEELKRIFKNKNNDSLEIVTFKNEKFVIKTDIEENERIKNQVNNKIEIY